MCGNVPSKSWSRSTACKVRIIVSTFLVPTVFLVSLITIFKMNRELDLPTPPLKSSDFLQFKTGLLNSGTGSSWEIVPLSVV